MTADASAPFQGALDGGACDRRDRGYVCTLLHTPIPWMLGPLFALAFLRIAGVDIGAPPPARYLGQWIIGTSLGLYFTPYVVRQVGDLWWLLVVGALFAIALGYISGIALARLAGFDKTTGIFASVPGGAAEMAVLGERFGGRMDRIAAAQSLRILIVVAIVPAAITALGVHGADPYVQGAKVFDGGGFALLMALTFAGSLVFQWLRMPNAFVLGSLAVAIPLTAAEVDLSLLPPLVSNIGQCLLGCALGSRFQADFLRGAHRFVGAVALTVVLSIVLSAAFGVAVAWIAGHAARDAGAGDGARRHGRDVHHGEGAAARRAAGHRVPRHAARGAAAGDAARVRARAALVSRRARRKR